VNVIQRPVVEIKVVKIVEGRTTEKIVNFAKEGILHVKAIKKNAPCKAQVWVYSEDNKQRGNSWTRKDGKPLEYKLLPGSYYAKVQDRTDRSVREIRDIRLQSGKTATVNAAFPVEKKPPAVSRTQEQSAPTVEKPSPKALAAPQAQGLAPGGKGPIMGGAVPLYRDAVVKNSMNMGNGTVVAMESSGSPAEIVSFYKKAMTERGWSVMMEMARDKRATLMLQKDNKQLMLGAKKRGEKTNFSLTLIKK